MAALVFCNSCFKKPHGASPKYFLTSCGHVACEQCLQKGKKEECVVCRASCRTLVLSKKTDSHIQSLFMGIEGLCRKYSKEITQIAQFQEKHRRQLLAHHRKKITKLEGYLKTATQQLQHIKQSQQKVSSMEVDYVPSLARKTETVTGPTRISLISPPQNGHMGTVACRSSQSSGMTSCQNRISGSVRSSPARIPNNEISYMSPFISPQNVRNCTQDAFGQRSSHYYQPQPSLTSVTRHPISLTSLLQRHHLGSTSHPGYSLQK